MRFVSVLTQLDELKLRDIVSLGQTGTEGTHQMSQADGLALLLEDPTQLVVEPLWKYPIAKEGQLADFRGDLNAVVHKTRDVVSRIFVDEIVVEHVGKFGGELIRSQESLLATHGERVHSFDRFGIPWRTHLNHSGRPREASRGPPPPAFEITPRCGSFPSLSPIRRQILSPQRGPRYLRNVDPESLFRIVGDALVPLRRSFQLPDAIRESLDSQVERWLDRPVITIAKSDAQDRPELLVLDANGGLHGLLIERADVQTQDRILAIDSWMSTLRIRDLGTLVPDPLAFYEELCDLSPEMMITLTSRTYHVLTTDPDLEITPDIAGIGVECHQIDVYVDEDAMTVVSMGPESRPRPTRPSTAKTPTVSTPTTVDLGIGPTQLPPPPLRRTAGPNRITQGRVFRADRLPFLFDPVAKDLTLINDTVFAIGSNLVVVAQVDAVDSDASFPNRATFRWTVDRELRDLVETHWSSEGAGRRTHLFVESDDSDGFALYVGEIDPTIYAGGVQQFAVSPPLDGELHSHLLNGVLPPQGFTTTVDLPDA